MTRIGKCSARILALVAAVLAACSGGMPLTQLDERTGVTLTRGAEPLVFARTEPRYSRSARDYVYVGPVETNRQGVREYYLWIGVATTLDRGFFAPAVEAPRSLYVSANGEPMEFPLRPWRELVATSMQRPVYATAVELDEELAARVTLQQLQLLDSGRLESIAIDLPDQGAPRAYARWQDHASFGGFLANVGGRTAGN